MDTDYVARHWALFAALAVVAVVAIRALPQIWRRTSRGRLSAQVSRLREAERARKRALRSAAREAKRVAALEEKAGRIRPRDMERARGRLADAELLAKAHADKAMVETNRLRMVIHEEFPPDRHDAMRARYLPKDLDDGRPFSF